MLRDFPRTICPRCGRDITSPTNQADCTVIHMRNCKGRRDHFSFIPQPREPHCLRFYTCQRCCLPKLEIEIVILDDKPICKLCFKAKESPDAK